MPEVVNQFIKDKFSNQKNHSKLNIFQLMSSLVVVALKYKTPTQFKSELVLNQV